jgi:ATP-dependent RNA helicase RhlB
MTRELHQDDDPPVDGGQNAASPPPAAGSDAGVPPENAQERHRRRKHWTAGQFQVPPKEGETRFHDFGLPDVIMHAVADLGFQYCTPIQAKVLAHAHAGRNISGRAQTGTGKTAAFLIAIFSRFLNVPASPERPVGRPRALVLAPTRELVIQIAADAQALGKYCHFHCLGIYGGLDFNKQQSWLEKRPVDIVVATPGRLLDFVRRQSIDLSHIEEFVVDEADRMLDMGFIPDVKRIIRVVSPKQHRRTMLYSATLTEDVLRLAAQWMPDPVICEVEPEQVAVDTVEQIVYIVTTNDKFKVLYNILQQRPGERVLIFCNRRDSSHALAHKLRTHKVDCELLSGAVRQKKRLRILDDFKDGKAKVVVATDVAGRGLHVKDITLVVNYEFPYEAEDYVHRIGRTGRAGVTGTSISFACEDESFIIPAIEKYIGNPLNCTMPGESLLTPVPHIHGVPEIRDVPTATGDRRPKPRPRARRPHGPRHRR